MGLSTNGRRTVRLLLVRVRDTLLIYADGDIVSMLVLVRGSRLVLLDKSLELDLGEDVGDVKTLILRSRDGYAVLECSEGLCVKRGEL